MSIADAADPPLAVTFDLRADDHLAASRLVGGGRASVDPRFWVAGLVFGGSLAVTFGGLATAGALTGRSSAISAALAAVVATIVVRLSVADPAVALRRAVEQQAAFGTRRTVTLSPDGFETTHRFGHSQMHWAGVTRAARTDGHLLLFLRNGTAMPVPRRAFASAAAFAAFAAFAEACVPPPDVTPGPPTGGFPVLPPSRPPSG